MGSVFETGTLRIDIVRGGRFLSDGGPMFGLVPKVLWSRYHSANDQNLIPMECQCLLVRGPFGTMVVDTGYGDKIPERRRRSLGMEDGHPLVASLAQVGLRPEEVDIVLLTHLHFDHAGGCTSRAEDGGLRLVFPRARHLVQRAEWEDATCGAPELADGYLTDDFLLLEESGQLELLDGDAEIVPGVSVVVTKGHTRGHQSVLVGDGTRGDGTSGSRAFYLADLCPFASHLRLLWGMAYDTYPLDTRRSKIHWLGRAAEEGWTVLFNHDPGIQGGTVVRDKGSDFRLIDPIPVERPQQARTTLPSVDSAI